VGEADSVKYAKYDGWGMHVPEGEFKFEVGPAAFEETVRKFGGGEAAVEEWRAFMASLEPIINVSVAMTPLALRSDLGAAATVGRFLPALMGAGFSPAVTGPILDVAKRSVTNKFILNWLEFLSFAISGLPADSTIAAAMAYTLRDLHQPEAELDYPVGGSGAIVAALVRALNKHSHRNEGKAPGEPMEDRLALSAHVDQVPNRVWSAGKRGGHCFNRLYSSYFPSLHLSTQPRSSWRTGAPSASSCARAASASARAGPSSPTPASGTCVV